MTARPACSGPGRSSRRRIPPPSNRRGRRRRAAPGHCRSATRSRPRSRSPSPCPRWSCSRGRWSRRACFVGIHASVNCLETCGGVLDDARRLPPGPFGSTAHRASRFLNLALKTIELVLLDEAPGELHKWNGGSWEPDLALKCRQAWPASNGQASTRYLTDGFEVVLSNGRAISSRSTRPPERRQHDPQSKSLWVSEPVWPYSWPNADDEPMEFASRADFMACTSPRAGI